VKPLSCACSISCETAMKGAETVLSDLGGHKVTLAYMEKRGIHLKISTRL